MDAYDYMNQAYELGKASRESVRLIEEAIKSADAANDVDAGYDARKMLMEAAYEIGLPKKQLLAFAWMIKQYEAEAIRIDEFDLMWKYKWVVNNVVDFPEISRQQIERLLDDMKQKYLNLGYSLKPYLKLRAMIAMSMGQVEEVPHLVKEWKAAKKDYMNDCPACETNDEVCLQFFHHEYQHTVDKARALISGRQKCGEVPHLTNGMLALAFWQLGNQEAAEERFKKGYKLTKGNADFLNVNADFVQYLVASEQWQLAQDVLNNELKVLPDSENKFRQYRLYAAAAVFLQAAHKQGLNVDLALDAATIKTQAEQGAKAFDARNGNDYYTQQLTTQLAVYA